MDDAVHTAIQSSVLIYCELLASDFSPAETHNWRGLAVKPTFASLV